MPRRKYNGPRVCGGCGTEIEKGRPCPGCQGGFSGVTKRGGAPPRPGGGELEALVAYCQARCDGWLRIVPAATGETHWKWRFTQGRWEGFYIYYCQLQHETAATAFHGLEAKLCAVDEGVLRPSKDVFR